MRFYDEWKGSDRPEVALDFLTECGYHVILQGPWGNDKTWSGEAIIDTGHEKSDWEGDSIPIVHAPTFSEVVERLVEAVLAYEEDQL